MINKSVRILAPLLVGVCILMAKVVTDYDHSVDFQSYKTYSWLKVQASDSIWEDRIRRAIDSELVGKGWTLAPAGDASLAAFGSTQRQPVINTFYNDFGGGWYWRGFGGMGTATTTVESVPIGTLVVDIFDTPSKKLIWRAKASDVLPEKPEKDEKKLEKVISEMFKHFPPHSKG
ncbi:MAG: hypothetical protein QOJ99_2759 [Bryobacterales bacterium]|nr:hypothetical protein [Bryobacterales bacterium]